MTTELIDECLTHGRKLIVALRNQSDRCRVALELSALSGKLSLNREEEFRFEQLIRAYLEWEKEARRLAIDISGELGEDFKFVQGLVQAQRRVSELKINDPALDLWLERGLDTSLLPRNVKTREASKDALPSFGIPGLCDS